MDSAKWIFFDLGSTLIDESECYKLRFREAVEGTAISLDEFEKKVIEFSKQKLKGDHETVKFYGIKLPPWHKEAEKPYDNAENVLKHLSQKGYRLGVIANQSFGTKERLENWGLIKYFDIVLASAEEGVSKPDIEIFRRALTAANCPPENAAMVGDRLDNDIVPAKKLGMKTVRIKQGFNGYARVTNENERADHEINDLSELIKIF